MKNKKKAFTLTELLVVIIVLGVLSTVAVPKFTRVMESRKTTEAEQILGSLRAEQESRCIAGKKYLMDLNKIPSLSSAKQSKNYTYTLGNLGAEAASPDKAYTIKMPFYQSGQICCDGDYCSSLNKRYPSCSTLTLVSADECAGYTECDANSKPTTSEQCGYCGTRTRDVTCNMVKGVWETGEWSPCTGQGVCAAGSSENGSCSAVWAGYEGSTTRTCSNTCQWNAWNKSACEQTCESNPNQLKCCSDIPQQITDKYWNGSACVDCGSSQSCCSLLSGYQWKNNLCIFELKSKPCLLNRPDAETRSCGKCGKQARIITCNSTTGKWEISEKFGPCTGETGECIPGSQRLKGTLPYCTRWEQVTTQASTSLNEFHRPVTEWKQVEYDPGQTCTSECKWVTNSCEEGWLTKPYY